MTLYPLVLELTERAEEHLPLTEAAQELWLQELRAALPPHVAKATVFDLGMRLEDCLKHPNGISCHRLHGVLAFHPTAEKPLNLTAAELVGLLARHMWPELLYKAVRLARGPVPRGPVELPASSLQAELAARLSKDWLEKGTPGYVITALGGRGGTIGGIDGLIQEAGLPGAIGVIVPEKGLHIAVSRGMQLKLLNEGGLALSFSVNMWPSFAGQHFCFIVTED
jgi:hypothetical protein